MDYVKYVYLYIKYSGEFVRMVCGLLFGGFAAMMANNLSANLRSKQCH